MSMSEYEIGRIAEIVAGKVGAQLSPKDLRRVVDTVVDSLKNQQGNLTITGATCEVSGRETEPAHTYSNPQPLPPDQALLREKGGLYQQIEATDSLRIIVAAFGKNRPGVVAAITAELAQLNCSIEDMSQTLMQDFFSLIMVVDIRQCAMDFTALRDRIQSTEAQLGMKVYVMREDIFRYMHRI